MREELVRKKDELTRISGPIFQRVDQAYRRLEEVHGRQGEVIAWMISNEDMMAEVFQQYVQGIGGALQLVDLAGADFDDRDLASTTSTTSTNSTTAQQRKESIDINKSLLALKECFRYEGKRYSRSASGMTAIEYSKVFQERWDEGVKGSKSLFPWQQADQAGI